jgi:hypothetical protein
VVGTIGYWHEIRFFRLGCETIISQETGRQGKSVPSRRQGVGVQSRLDTRPVTKEFDPKQHLMVRVADAISAIAAEVFVMPILEGASFSRHGNLLV